jgi:Uma2 family endonuclease
MTAAIDRAALARIPINKRRVGYVGYLALESSRGERLELVDGWVYAMAGGSPRHARLAMRVGRLLGNQLERTPCEPYSSDLKIHIGRAKRTTYADVVIVCGEPRASSEDDNTITNPTVIVEVLSPSTASEDRGAKWSDYRRLPSLRHYVLVSQDERLVEVYSRDGLRWAYEDARDRGAIALEAIGAPLDVAELYAGILPTAARSGGARPSRGRPHG